MRIGRGTLISVSNEPRLSSHRCRTPPLRCTHHPILGPLPSERRRRPLPHSNLTLPTPYTASWLTSVLLRVMFHCYVGTRCGGTRSKDIAMTVFNFATAYGNSRSNQRPLLLTRSQYWVAYYMRRSFTKEIISASEMIFVYSSLQLPSRANWGRATSPRWIRKAITCPVAISYPSYSPMLLLLCYTRWESRTSVVQSPFHSQISF